MFDLRTVSDHENEYYKLTIPKECSLLELDLEASSADITVDGVNVEGSIEVSSGDVNINRTKGEDLKLTSSSGHIDLANAEYEKLNVEVSSGDIKIGNRKLDGDYMTDDDKSKSIKAETSSGSVTISFK